MTRGKFFYPKEKVRGTESKEKKVEDGKGKEQGKLCWANLKNNPFYKTYLYNLYFLL
jgi:hypothetical protein